MLEDGLYSKNAPERRLFKNFDFNFLKIIPASREKSSGRLVQHGKQFHRKLLHEIKDHTILINVMVDNFNPMNYFLSASTFSFTELLSIAIDLLCS